MRPSASRSTPNEVPASASARDPRRQLMRPLPSLLAFAAVDVAALTAHARGVCCLRRASSSAPLILLVSMAGSVGCDPESWWTEEVGGPSVSAVDVAAEGPAAPEATSAALAVPPATEVADDTYPLTALADGGWVYDQPTVPFSATIFADGRVGFRDRVAARGNPLDDGLRFADPSEWERRPDRAQTAHAREKLAFLRWTSARRQRLASDAAFAGAGEAEDRLRNELELLWGDAQRPAGERRRLIFARWDECLEGATRAGESPLDESRARAGERARLLIELFVRERLPAGDANAFTSRELAEMNADRRSVRRFDPYVARE